MVSEPGYDPGTCGLWAQSGDFSLWKRRMYAHQSVSGLKYVFVEKSPIVEAKETTSDQDPEDKN